ncbi:MAG TPA: AI-2E family transporter [Caproiciproducens sp.]|nr:AI-2E family transporter [Caproiciproducens sp.]
MFSKEYFIRLRPLFIYFLSYTVLFFLFAATLNYTFPFLAGFSLALAAQPLIRTLKKHLRLKPAAASVLSTIIVFVILFSLLYLLGCWLIQETNNLLEYLQNISQTSFCNPKLLLNRFLDGIGAYFKNLDAKFIETNQEQLLGFAQSGTSTAITLLGTIVGFLTSVSAIITMFIVMIFSTYFFSKDMGSIKDGLMSLLPKRISLNIHSASHRGANMSGKFICSYILIYFITFVETLIVFTALGVPYPLVISIITGIADVLPVLGPGTIYIPLAFIYLFCGDFFRAGTLIVCWLLITAIRQMIEPKIISSSINVHPLTMLAAIYFALVANNFWVLLYFCFLIIVYQILVSVGVLQRAGKLIMENAEMCPYGSPS